MKTFKKGTPVRLNVPVVEGVVVASRLMKDDEEKVECQVLITLPSGESHLRYFSADELTDEISEEDIADIKARHDDHVDKLHENHKEDLHFAKLHGEEEEDNE